MKKGTILENITVEKLVFGGKWMSRLSSENPDLDGRVIMITGGPIPGAVVNLRVLKTKKNYLETQIVETIKKSPIEKQHPNNQYGLSGGWRWINIPYEEQLKIKQDQVIDALRGLNKYIPLSSEGEGLGVRSIMLPIEPSPTIDGYRNKVEFSFGKYISHKFEIDEQFNVGFHKQWEFSKVEDFDGCPLIDDIQNTVFLEIKNFCKTLGLPVYDSMRNAGFFRHLMIRKTHFTNQMMILLSFNPEYFTDKPNLDSKEKMSQITDFLIGLQDKYSEVTSVYLSHNPNKADTCIWDLELIAGEPTITEELLWLTFHISPTSFFQTNSSWAEKLYNLVTEFAALTQSLPEGEKQNNTTLKDMTVLDLYWGTGTIGMIFARSWAKHVESVELVTSASKDGEKNAKLNKLDNIWFTNAKVEEFLDTYLSQDKKADLLIIDPPRAGMHPKALPNILKFGTQQMIYVSCNPTTLARDLEYILQNSPYKIEKIQAMDMFPHTSHIETIVSLKK